MALASSWEPTLLNCLAALPMKCFSEWVSFISHGPSHAPLMCIKLNVGLLLAAQMGEDPQLTAADTTRLPQWLKLSGLLLLWCIWPFPYGRKTSATDPGHPLFSGSRGREGRRHWEPEVNSIQKAKSELHHVTTKESGNVGISVMETGKGGEGQEWHWVGLLTGCPQHTRCLHHK